MQVLWLLGLDLDVPVWLLIILGLLVAYYMYMTWKFDTFKKLNIKGPKPVPIFGNLIAFFKKGFDYDGEIIKEYGQPVGMFVGREPNMIITDPEILRAILVKEFDHFVDRTSLDIKSKPMGRSLTLLRGNEWRHVRNTLTPTFSSGKLKVMLKQTNECANQLLENLHEYANKHEAFDVLEYCGAYTMDVIARTGFGYELDTQKDPNNKFIVMAKKIINAGLRSPIMVVLIFMPCLMGILLKLKLISTMPKDAEQFFIEFTRQAYQQRLQGGKKENVDFLQLMVNAHQEKVEDDEQVDGFKSVFKTKKKLSEDDILANGLVFFVAGYDTTANTMSFIAYHVAANPDIQDRLIAEIEEVVGNKRPAYEDLYKMPYIEQVVSEALRMYPQVPVLSRNTEKEITIKGVYFPKDMLVRIPVKYFHYNPEIYPEPEKFDPDRFSAEQKAQRNPYHYLPFGLGPRMCIGNRLALMGIKIAFIRILQQFRLATCAETEIPIKVQKLRVKPDGKLMLKVIKRS